MALHVLGSGEAQASVREFAHQLRRGMPLNKEIDSHHWVDGLNELQIRERHHLSNAELVAQLAVVGPKAVKGRWHTPPPARYLPIPFGPPVVWAPLKYLLDVGFTRDVWAHRIDIDAAINRPMQLSADHDGRLVAEWASIHGQGDPQRRFRACGRRGVNLRHIGPSSSLRVPTRPARDRESVSLGRTERVGPNPRRVRRAARR